MGHMACGHIARGSQVFRGRETYEKTSPDDLETLNKKTRLVARIYPSTRWADNATTRVLVRPPSTCQIVR
jgi:hypothetical protein